MNTEQVAAARARALRLVSAATSDLRNVVLNYNSGGGGVVRLEDIEVGDAVNDEAVRAAVARSKRAVRFALVDDDDDVEDEDENGGSASRPSSKGKGGKNSTQEQNGDSPPPLPLTAEEATQAAFLKLLERTGWACASIQAQGQDRAAATKLIAAALEFMLSGGALAYEEKNLLLL